MPFKLKVAGILVSLAVGEIWSSSKRWWCHDDHFGFTLLELRTPYGHEEYVMSSDRLSAVLEQEDAYKGAWLLTWT